MKVNDFVNKAIEIATKHKTLYVMGCFGAPLNATNKKRYTTNHSYNKQASRVKMINNATADTFGFDCVCLIKAILWGWNADTTKTYGGAKYCSNNVPDIDANQMIGSTYCSNVSTDFNKIEKGEVVWRQGHIGIYIGDGKVVECTPSWENKVQITKITQQAWKKHGKLKYIEYTETKPTTTEKPATTQTQNKSISVTYQVWDDVRNKWLPNVTDATTYAGVFNNSVCCVYANLSKGNIYYKVHTKGGKWLPEVKNRTDYAGLFNKPIDALMVRTDTGKKIYYAVHLKKSKKWLPYVTGYNEKDSNNGYAGIIGQEIDAIKMYVK